MYALADSRPWCFCLWQYSRNAAQTGLMFEKTTFHLAYTSRYLNRCRRCPIAVPTCNPMLNMCIKTLRVLFPTTSRVESCSGFARRHALNLQPKTKHTISENYLPSIRRSELNTPRATNTLYTYTSFSPVFEYACTQPKCNQVQCPQ